MQANYWNRRQFIGSTVASGLGCALSGVTRCLPGASEEAQARIPVGVITQSGGAHLSTYFRSLAAAPEVGSVTVADPSGESFEAARRHLGSKLRATYDSSRTLLRSVRPVMAVISMEAAEAPPAIAAALEAGCHVLTEKPSCLRAEDFEPLVHKAAEGNRHLMVAFMNRLRPRVRKAREIVQSGEIGKVYAVEAHLVADQTRLTRASYREQWFCKRERSGGGHLIWLGIHWLDLMFYITGLAAVEVTGFAGVVGGQPIDIEDSAAMSMKFSNGAFGTMTSGYYLDTGYHSRIKIWGSGGWLEMSAVENKPLQWYSTKGDVPKRESLEYPKHPGYAPFVRSCVRASAGLEPAPISGAEGLRVLRTIFAFYRAVETGQTQKVVTR